MDRRACPGPQSAGVSGQPVCMRVPNFGVGDEHMRFGLWTCPRTRGLSLLCWSGTRAVLPATACVTVSDLCLPLPTSRSEAVLASLPGDWGGSGVAAEGTLQEMADS